MHPSIDQSHSNEKVDVIDFNCQEFECCNCVDGFYVPRLGRTLRSEVEIIYPMLFF